MKVWEAADYSFELRARIEGWQLDGLNTMPL